MLSEVGETLQEVLDFVGPQTLHFNCRTVDALEKSSFFTWPVLLQNQQFMLGLGD